MKAEIGSHVEVQVWNSRTNRAEWSGRGVVTEVFAADDRPYRINVRGEGSARAWNGCAPECVRPDEIGCGGQIVANSHHLSEKNVNEEHS